MKYSLYIGGLANLVVGEWQQLTVASHSRKVLGGGPPPDTPTFDAAAAIAVDNMSPTTVSAIPDKSFSSFAIGEPGVLYYMGGLHSDYRGNEIDKIDLRTVSSTQITTEISNQPRIPPTGPDSGYSAGASGYIYRQYGTVSTGERSLWQPYSHHTYTKTSWHPEWGVTLMAKAALADGETTGTDPNGNGSGYPQVTSGHGLMSYNWSEGKYHLRVDPAPGTGGCSDWNPHRQSLAFLETGSQFNCYVNEVYGTSSTVIADYNFPISNITGGAIPAWYPNTNGNGVLIKHMEGNKYLVLRCDGSNPNNLPNAVSTWHTLFILSLSPYQATYALTPPPSALVDVTPSADGNFTFCIDKNSRRIFWMVFTAHASGTQAVRFYVSTFDTPVDWTEITGANFPTISGYGSWLASHGRSALAFYDGYLFVQLPVSGPSDPGYTGGALNLHRIKVDSSEELPLHTFNRFDYIAQDFRYSYSLPMTALACKHTCWAYSPIAGKYYQCAGDIQHSYSQSMASLTFDGTGRGYTFAEVLDELTPAPVGKVRPAATDDGAFYYVPTDSAWVAARGKLVYQKGGEGVGVRSSQPMQNAYPTDEAAYADRWDIAGRYFVWDYNAPGGFDKMDGSDGWTQDNGGIVYPNVWTKGVGSSRMGAFDPVTGCVWRIYDAHVLVCFDMPNKAVTVFNLTAWVSPDTGRTIFMDGVKPTTTNQVTSDGSKENFCWYDSGAGRWRTYGDFHWEHKATWIDPATGYLYIVSPGTGYLWRYDTRGPHTLTGDGWRLNFEPFGKRIPLVSCYPPLDSRTTWPPVIYNGDVAMNSRLFPFKGGLLWLSTNHHTSGDAGENCYAFWRRLDYTGDWSVITLPAELVANTGAAKNVYSANNDEIMLISQMGTDIDRQYYKYFWKMT